MKWQHSVWMRTLTMTMLCWLLNSLWRRWLSWRVVKHDVNSCKTWCTRYKISKNNSGQSCLKTIFMLILIVPFSMTIIVKVRLYIYDTTLLLVHVYVDHVRDIFNFYCDLWPFRVRIKKIKDCRYFHILFIFMFHLSK